MSVIKPKYITFDCYGTLTHFEMAETSRVLFKDRLTDEQMEEFVKVFAAYRFDEILGAWQPYKEVVRNAVQRSCKRLKIEYRDADSAAIYQAVPTWGPHPDVSEPLARIAKHIPLVIFSNAMDDQIGHNVEKLGAPFYKVFTAQQAQAYKPRLAAFEYMLENLNCGPMDVLHVSSSFRYDLMSAHDMGIRNKAFVNRGHEPANPYYGYHEIKDIGGLPALVGL